MGVTAMSDQLARPALPTLLAQQRELIDHEETPATDLRFSLRDGFADRRELIRWYQAATVRTFGALGEYFEPRRLWADHTLLQACIVSPNRQRWADVDSLPLDVAAAHRRVIEEEALHPAMHDAYNQLRKMAGEYLGDGDGETYSDEDIDPDRNDVAMRPAFSRKDAEQARALRRLWSGFEDADAVRTWLHDLQQPSNGAVREGLAGMVMRDDVALSHLLTGQSASTRARLYREWLAIRELLPAFRAGIERMDTGELAKRTRGGDLEVAPG